MYLRWKTEENRPKHYHGGVTGKVFAVDPKDGLLLADVGDADAEEMLGTAEVVGYADAADAQSRIAEHVGLLAVRSGAPAPASGFDPMAWLRGLVSGKSGRRELRALLETALTDDEKEDARQGGASDAAVVPPAIPPSPVLPDDLDEEMKIKLAEAFGLLEHKAVELMAECKGRGLPAKKGEGKEILVARLLGLPEDWHQKYGQA